MAALGGYKEVEDFQDIRLLEGAIVTNRGDSGGSIQVQGRNLTLTNGSAIEAIVTGSGAGGSLTVNASESVQLIGTTADGQSPSALSTQTQGLGDAGDLVIETGRLIVRDGAQVGTGTFGSGQGGAVTVNASNSVELIGSGSGLFAQANPGSKGDAGNLTIDTQQLTIRDGAQITVSDVESGNAGNLEVVARSIRLDNQGTIVPETAETVPIPEPSPTLGILAFAAFSAAKVLKRKQKKQKCVANIS